MKNSELNKEAEKYSIRKIFPTFEEATERERIINSLIKKDEFKIVRIQSFSSWALVFATLLLVCATWFYVNSTREMVDISNKQFQLSNEQFQSSNRPYLFVDSFETEIDKNGIFSFIFFIKNTGDIPARFEIEKVYYVFGGEEYYSTSLFQQDMFVFPGSQGRRMEIIEPTTELIGLVTSEDSLKIVIKINYWGIGDEKMVKTFTFEQHMELARDPHNPTEFNKSIIFINAN